MVRIVLPTAVCPPEGWLIARFGLSFQLCAGISAIIGPAHDVHFCTTNGFCRFIGGGGGQGLGWLHVQEGGAMRMYLNACQSACDVRTECRLVVLCVWEFSRFFANGACLGPSL